MENNKPEAKWTLVMSEDIKQKAIDYCDTNNIKYKEYAEQRLDPDCPKKEAMRTLELSDDCQFKGKSVDELIDLLIEERIKRKIIEEIKRIPQ